MNKFECSRSLLLEQLESRCMLAAGMFAQSLHHGEHGRHDAPERSGLVDFTSNAGELRNFSRFQSDRVQVVSRDSVGPRGLDRPLLNLDDFRPLPLTPIVSSQSSNQTIIILESRTPTTPSVPTDRPRTGQLRLSEPNSPAGNLSAAIATPTVDTTESLLLDSRQLTVEIEREVSVVATFNNRPTTDPSLSGVSSRFPGFDRASADAINPIQSTESGGVIESLRQLRHEFQAPAESDTEEEPWQLDTRSIERIREVSRKPSPPTDPITSRYTDAAIASWFDHSTGLIEIEATGKLHVPMDVDDSIVDVVLNATVGLHRSIDLIASATDVESVPDDVRSAILAAIAAEQLPPSPDAASQPGAIRATAISYPGAAILATGITLAARRRRHGGIMVATNAPAGKHADRERSPQRD